jgi:hypothetical protein
MDKKQEDLHQSKQETPEEKTKRLEKKWRLAKLLIIPPFQSFYVIWYCYQIFKAHIVEFWGDEDTTELRAHIKNNEKAFLVALALSCCLMLFFPATHILNYSTFALARWSYGIWSVLSAKSNFPI